MKIPILIILATIPAVAFADVCPDDKKVVKNGCTIQYCQKDDGTWYAKDPVCPDPDPEPRTNDCKNEDWRVDWYNGKCWKTKWCEEDGKMKKKEWKTIDKKYCKDDTTTTTTTTTSSDDHDCYDDRKDCCKCIKKCVKKKKGRSKEKKCIKNQCKGKCKDAADECSGYKRKEWKDFFDDECSYGFDW